MTATIDYVCGVTEDELRELSAEVPLSLDDFSIPYKPTFSPAEIAEYFGVSVKTIEREIAEGNMRALRVRSGWRVPLPELKRYLLCQQAAAFLAR